MRAQEPTLAMNARVNPVAYETLQRLKANTKLSTRELVERAIELLERDLERKARSRARA